MASNHGIPLDIPPPTPLPPPPHHSNAPKNGMGSLYHPPPPQYQQVSTQYHQHQPMIQSSMIHPTHNVMLHQQDAASQQQQYPGNLSYSQYQNHQFVQRGYHQQQHQQQHYSQQYSPYPHPQYNYCAAAPPPPPPPPPRPSKQRNNNNKQKHNTNADVAKSLRQSMPPTQTPNAANIKQPKKINPKMAKKYSGRGLKTITIAGPGMPTQRFKICVGNHPDDVQRWIEERKKRFPRMDGSHRKTVTTGTKRSRQDEDDSAISQKKSCLDDENDNDSAKQQSNEEVQASSGLSSLLAGYGSSSSEDGEIAEPKNKSADRSSKDDSILDATKSSTVTETGSGDYSPPKRLCTFHQRGKCRHGTSCKFLHSDIPKDSSNNDQQRQNKRQSQSERDKARNQYQQELQVLGLATPSHGSRYTSGGKVINSTSLLHKLLQRDKERERSLTLQLLRYIVDCDYFQESESSTGKQNDDKADD